MAQTLDASLFDYDLPAERIAQEPLPERDASRLLVFERRTGRIEHQQFRDIADYLGAGDILVRNKAGVLPARLRGRRPTGGAVECFLLRPVDDASGRWSCLLRPGRKLPVGAVFTLADGSSATVAARQGDGSCEVVFQVLGGGSVTDLARRIGQVPLPPYIARTEGDPRTASDRERYQTVFADSTRPVAVAAPTAGLHFTPRLLERLSAQGVACADLCLHVGLGTFRPIETGRVEDHPIHREWYEMPEGTGELLRRPQGRRRVAVGTTSVRAAEDFGRRGFPRGNPDFSAEAGIFLYPPCPFLAVDALLTNFHQPRSTLLCLLASFLDPGGSRGLTLWREIYAEALARPYRFLSYGDAMLIL